VLTLQSAPDCSQAAKDSGCQTLRLDALASAACSAATPEQPLDGAHLAPPASQPIPVSPPATPTHADSREQLTTRDTQAALDLANLAGIRSAAPCKPSPRFEATGTWRAGTGPAKEDLKVFQDIGDGASVGYTVTI